MLKDLGAITGRDGILRVFSPRTGSLVGCSNTSGSVDTRGGPRQQCAWWDRAGMDFIITTGFGAPSQQRVYLWLVCFEFLHHLTLASVMMSMYCVSCST